MKRTLAQGLLAAVGLLLISASLVAHHGDAGRYEETLTTVTGTVVDLQLINPHSILILDVKEPDGKVVRWKGEWGSATALRRDGITRETVKVGDTITMRGRRLKNRSPFMTLSECARVYDATGKELFRGNDPGQNPGTAGYPVAGGSSTPASGAAKADPCAGPIK
jgi:hypothetical protein